MSHDACSTFVVHNKLEYLTDDTRAAAEDFLRILTAKNLNPKVLETWRSQERQDCLYKNYGPHSTLKKTNTNVSWHSGGRALDVSISPADLDSILFFLDTAQALGFTTVAKPEKIRAAIAAQTAPDLWDWHHVSYHGGRTKETAIAQYDTLMHAGPRPSQGALAIISNLFLIGAIVGLFTHGTKN